MAGTFRHNHHAASICDALVVGGGPAGLAAAIALRRRGLDVVLADALVPPIDKACGEGLMPDSRRELARLSVDLRRGYEFSGIHFASRGTRGAALATASFPEGAGIGVRRTDLHTALVERAEDLGVRLRWGARVDLGMERVTVAGESFRYRYLVGADGESSRVRSWAGLDGGLGMSKRFGFRRHFRLAPWSANVEVHWGSAGQAYVTPVAEKEICVAAVTRRRGLHFDGILETIPWLRERLSSQSASGRDRGGATTTRRLRRVITGNIALVGDASGSVDAITGEGLALSFRQAMLLGDALGSDSIQLYQQGHRAILSLPQAMAMGMLAMDRWQLARERGMRALAGDPQLFARLLAVHTGAESLAHFAATQGALLAWRLLVPAAEPAAKMLRPREDPRLSEELTVLESC